MSRALRQGMKLSSVLLVLAVGYVAAPAQAQSEGKAARPMRVGVHTQTGIFTPIGFGGLYLELEVHPRIHLMTGAGIAVPLWRVGVGAGFDVVETSNRRHALTLESWQSIGPWAGIGDPGQMPDDVNGVWDLMPMGTFLAGYSYDHPDGFALRIMIGGLTNYGVEPDNDGECNHSCSGPLAAPSIAVSLGYRFPRLPQ